MTRNSTAKARVKSWPAGVQLFELDQLKVLAFKQGILDGAGAKPGYARRPIGVALAGRWTIPLIDGGFDPRAPSCWLLEGFLFYLPREGIVRILEQGDRVRGSRARVCWQPAGFDIVNTATLIHPLTAPGSTCRVGLAPHGSAPSMTRPDSWPCVGGTPP
jgi:methyltransferase (TIGR00027 family)